MRLRNKKTGEIGCLLAFDGNNDCAVTNDGLDHCEVYTSLAELTAEWEDVDEPEVVYPSNDNELVIHFENSDECQKFYNKLLAWKRLKDKGFRFEGCVYNRLDGAFVIKLNDPSDSYEVQAKYLDDLDLLFGGKE